MKSQFFVDTMDALMIASELGEFTRKEWKALTKGMKACSLKYLATHDILTIREEFVKNIVCEKQAVIIHYPDGDLCYSPDQILPAVLKHNNHTIITEHKIVPIYRYWYSINKKVLTAEVQKTVKDFAWRSDYAERQILKYRRLIEKFQMGKSVLLAQEKRG